MSPRWRLELIALLSLETALLTLDHVLLVEQDPQWSGAATALRLLRR